MRIVWVILLLLVVSFNSFSIEPTPEIKKDAIDTRLSVLLTELGSNKIIPEQLQSAFYAALDFYPELKNVSIKVKFADIKTTMQCRPRWDFLFHRKSNRSYVIYVDNNMKSHNGVLFSQIPFNAQVGVFGHELAHIIDYQSKDNFSIISFGVDYLNHSRRKQIENKVDLIAIEKGLGYQLGDFSKYVFEDSGASIEYLKYKLKYYFKPFQIQKLIAQYPIYYSQNEVLKD